MFFLNDDSLIWSSTSIACHGVDDSSHHPTLMAFERTAGIVNDGATFRCTVCGRGKFVWRTPFLKKIKWKWINW